MEVDERIIPLEARSLKDAIAYLIVHKPDDMSPELLAEQVWMLIQIRTGR